MGEFFHRETGTTPSHYIQQVQFQHVERMGTRRKRKSITALSAKIKVPRATYYRLVKKMTGQTPGRRYRKYKKHKQS